MSHRPTVAFFRPDDGRLDEAIASIEAVGGRPLADPLLMIEPTGERPRSDAAVTILTSPTGAELAGDAGWKPGSTTLCAIGDSTAEAIRDEGYTVDVVPNEFSSTGLVERLASEVDGKRVEVARSDHGSAVLIQGLEGAGAYVHETVLYQLTIPEGAGTSIDAAVAGELDVALFTSSLTVEHFLSIADDRGVSEAAVSGLNQAVVGAIGHPTAATAADAGITVDVIPEMADFDDLARAALDR